MKECQDASAMMQVRKTACESASDTICANVYTKLHEQLHPVDFELPFTQEEMKSIQV